MTPRQPIAWPARARIARALALTCLLAAASAPATAAGPPCRAAAAGQLEELGIPAADVEDIAVVAMRTGGRDGGRIVELQAWSKLRSCRGSVVVRLTPFCRVKETYSRGGCRFATMPHF